MESPQTTESFCAETSAVMVEAVENAEDAVAAVVSYVAVVEIVPPFAAGARPTIISLEFELPNPVTGLPQYTSCIFCFLLFLQIFLLKFINLEHFLHLTEGKL